MSAFCQDHTYPPGSGSGPGTPGSTGPPGVDGEPGEDGVPGPPGAAGAAGATGPVGTMGPPGADGADGADGDMGPQGLPGVAGVPGATGPMGPPGMEADAGEDGYAIPGPPGATGPTGPQGSVGVPITMGSFVADVTQRRCARSGRFDVQPTVPFTQKQIGSPVIVHQMSGVIMDRGEFGDDAEMDPIFCAGEIIGPRTLRVSWTSRTMVRGEFKFAYMTM